MTSAFVPLLCAAKSHGADTSGSVINIASISGITKWYSEPLELVKAAALLTLGDRSQNSQFAYNVRIWSNSCLDFC